MTTKSKRCEDCSNFTSEASGAVWAGDPWGGHEAWKCKPCADNWEPGEPDLMAPSASERHEMEWKQKEALR